MKNPLIKTLVAAALISAAIPISAHAQFLPQFQQSPYQQMGYPVSGAYPNANQFNGSGQGMMNTCAYPQSTYDPSSAFDKDPLVVAAKADLTSSAKDIQEKEKAMGEKERALATAKIALRKSLTGITPDVLLKDAKACYDMKVSTPYANADAEVKAIAGTSRGLAGADATGYCYKARSDNFTADGNAVPAVPSFQIQNMCYSVVAPDDDKHIKAKINTKDGDECRQRLDDAWSAYQDWSQANDELKSAEAQEKDAAQGVADAQAEAKKINDDEIAAGITSATAGCANCVAGQAQQQKSVLSNGKFWGAVGLIGGISTLSILAQEHQYNNIARMGYIADPNQMAIIGSGISSGMGAGYPFLQSSLYGQTPMGGMRGGYGCAPTMNGGQFAQQGGNYFPYGGQYMPGAGPWGVSPYGGMPGMMGPGMGMGMPMMGMGMPGMMPGMGMGMPMMGMGMPGMMPGMGMGMGMPGMMMPGMMGGYNPYAQQAQYAQYMNQQMVDMMRQQQVAMYAVGYGLNNANQQYAYAQSMLGGMGGMGGYGGGMMMPGMGMGMGMPGMMMPGMMPGMGGPCGPSLLGVSSISICGSTGFGGGFAPTNTNYNYGGYAPAYAPGYNTGGLNTLSTGGVVNFR